MMVSQVYLASASGHKGVAIDSNKVPPGTICHPDLSSICTKCDSLFSTASNDLEHFECYSYIALEVSARNGCQVCALVFAQAQIVVASIDDGFQRYLSLPYHVRIYNYDPHWQLYFSLKRNYLDNGDGRNFVPLASISMWKWQGESPRVRHKVLENTGSHLNMELAQKWMRACQESHTDCTAQSSAYHSPPTRLVDIGQSNDHLRLIVVDTNLASTVKYVTLSHCWGKLDLMKLVQANLGSFQESIFYPHLPLTFRHAIDVARRLGFEYIWIDSLCIIQDDKDDWQREAPRMASVYGGSSLNISAAAAHDGSEGLFFDRDSNLVRDCLLLADPELAQSSRPKSTPAYKNKTKVLQDAAKKKSSRKVFRCIDSQVYDRSFALPLFQRAWVFQERFLTPRTLHFGKTQIFWECQSQVRFETLPDGIPKGINLAWSQSESWVTEKSNGFQRSWNSVLEHYSKCQLTVASDKMVAISGIAENFKSRYRGTYMHGLWLEHLPKALLWRSLDNTAARPQPLLAPTWSWVSISGPISADYFGDTSHAPVHTYFLSLPTSTTLILHLQCEKMLELTSQTLQPLSDVTWMFSIPATETQYEVQMEVLLYFDGIGRGRQDLPPALYALSIHSSHGIQDAPYPEEGGLLLQRVDGKKGHFRRMGTYQTVDKEHRTFSLAHEQPLTVYERKFVYERVIEGKDGEEDKYVVNLE